MTAKAKSAEAEAEAKTQELETEQARSGEMAARIKALEDELKAKDSLHQQALEEEHARSVYAFKASDEYLDEIADEFGNGIEWIKKKAAADGIILPEYEDQP